MYNYAITDEGIEKVEAYKILCGESNKYSNVLYVHGMYLSVDSKNKMLSLSYEITHGSYGSLHILLKDDVTLIGSNSITFVGDKE